LGVEKRNGKISFRGIVQETTQVLKSVEWMEFVKLQLPHETPFPRSRSRRKIQMLTISSVAEDRAAERLRQEELEEARAIQSVMLPAEALCAGPVTIAHKFAPVDVVGGDFLDYFELPDGTQGFYLGDVSGKGLSAAMYAALAVGILRGVHKTGQSPSLVVSTLNTRLMSRGGLRRHSAIVYGVFDPKKMEMRLASAGMPGPLLFSGGNCRIVELSGIPPGLFLNAEYETVNIKMEPGDTMLLCSDGIIEAQNARYEDFGVERLINICNSACGLTPTELLSHIFSEVHEFSHMIQQHDDMSATIFHIAE
jgi:sigma-B regulation protein RsbU (phosphoserine phosphatase)